MQQTVPPRRPLCHSSFRAKVLHAQIARKKLRGRKRRLMPFCITKLQTPTRTRSTGCELLGAIRSACPVKRRSTECERLTNLHERCKHFHITKKRNSFKEIAMEKIALQNPGPRTSRMPAAARLLFRTVATITSPCGRCSSFAFRLQALET